MRIERERYAVMRNGRTEILGLDNWFHKPTETKATLKLFKAENAAKSASAYFEFKGQNSEVVKVKEIIEVVE